VPSQDLRREFVIQELHEGGLAGHFGLDKTVSLVEDNFFFPDFTAMLPQ
jgi:hypothetical protein